MQEDLEPIRIRNITTNKISNSPVKDFFFFFFFFLIIYFLSFSKVILKSSIRTIGEFFFIMTT